MQEWEPEGTGRKGTRKEKLLDGARRNVTNHGLREDTGDRDMWGNLVLGGGKPLYVGQILG